MLPLNSLVAVAVAALFVQAATQTVPTVDDPEVRTAVERFFAAQEREDVAGYLALWSTQAQRPRPEQLTFVFESGDDAFSDLAVTRVIPIGERLRVQVTVTRSRTDTRVKRPDGSAATFNSRRVWSLTFVREDGALKLLSEGLPADDLAHALIEAKTAEEREQLLSAEPELLNERLIHAISQRASNFAQLLQFAPARSAYERALEVARRIGDRKAEGEALQNIGNALYFQRNFAGALASYDTRLAIERASANDAGVAAALLGIATIRYSRFEYGEALANYSEALATYEKLQDEAGIATTLVSTGNVLYLQGDYDGAVRDYARSRDLNRKLLNTDGEARALDGLGRAFMAQGDFTGALSAFTAVAEAARARGEAARRGNAAQSIGEVHFRLGNNEAARASFEESRGYFEAGKDLRAVGRVWQGIALTDLVAARFAPAEAAYGKSGEACAAGQDSECVARALVGLAFAQQAQQHYDAAVASYRKGIAAFESLDKWNEAARARVGLSQTHLGRKDYPAALAEASQARATQVPPDIVWRSRLAGARALRRLAQPTEATAATRIALDVISGMVDAADKRPSTRVPDDVTAAYAFAAVLRAEAGDAPGAFTFIEQGRALALRITLGPNERDIARGMTPAEREAERAAAIRVGSLHAQIEKERELPKPDMARIEQLGTRLREQTAERTESQRQLFDRHPQLAMWRGIMRPADPVESAPFLGEPHSVVALFAIDDDDLVAVTAASREDGSVDFRAQVTPTTRQALAERIAAVVTPAALSDVAAWRTASISLLKVLPRAAIDAIAAARQAVVLPDDVLWRVPFEALPAGDKFVGDRTAITYAGSVTSLLRPHEADAAPQDPEVTGRPRLKVLAAAAPSLDDARRARIKETAPTWVLRPDDVARREVTAAMSQLPAAARGVLLGPELTESAFRGAVMGADALHIGVPFRLNSASPLFSRALLTAPEAATAANASDDGLLEAREVMNLDLQAGVTILTDGGTFSMRDAAAAAGTLQWVWRAAGSASMIVPRWASDDPSSDKLLAEFHRRVHAGETSAAALRASLATVRAAEGTRAPWYWARWMVLGR